MMREKSKRLRWPDPGEGMLEIVAVGVRFRPKELVSSMGTLDVFRADQATMFDSGLSAFERKFDMTDVGQILNRVGDGAHAFSVLHSCDFEDEGFHRA